MGNRKASRDLHDRGQEHNLSEIPGEAKQWHQYQRRAEAGEGAYEDRRENDERRECESRAGVRGVHWLRSRLLRGSDSGGVSAL